LGGCFGWSGCCRLGTGYRDGEQRKQKQGAGGESPEKDLIELDVHGRPPIRNFGLTQREEGKFHRKGRKANRWTNPNHVWKDRYHPTLIDGKPCQFVMSLTVWTTPEVHN